MSYNVNNDKSKTKKTNICFNFEYSLTLKNYNFIKKQSNKIKIRKLISLILMREIKKIKINEYVITQLYINNIITNKKLIIVYVIVEIYLINDLKVNILIKINILKSQKIILNFEHNILTINNY